jgi:hypothetical protein
MGEAALLPQFRERAGSHAESERKSMQKLVKSDKRTSIPYTILFKRTLAIQRFIVHNAITAADAHLSVPCGHTVGKQ